MIKHEKYNYIIKDDFFLSSTTHDNKLNIDIRDDTVVVNIDVNTDVILKNSSCYNSIPFSDLEVSFLKYIVDTNNGEYIINSNNCNVMINNYFQFKKYTSNLDHYCRTNKWYSKIIVFELIIKYLVIYNKNATGHELDKNRQFTDWVYWDHFYYCIYDHCEDDK